jgi:hypothetical protein
MFGEWMGKGEREETSIWIGECPCEAMQIGHRHAASS